MDHGSTLTGLQQLLGGTRTAGGLDIALTKIAVDFQNLDGADATTLIAEGVETIRAGTGMRRRLRRTCSIPPGSACSASSPPATRLPPSIRKCCRASRSRPGPGCDASFSHLRLLGIAGHGDPAACPGRRRGASAHPQWRGGAAGRIRDRRPARRVHRVLLRPAAGGLERRPPAPAEAARHPASRRGSSAPQSRQTLAEIAERDAVMITIANDGTWDFEPRDGVLRFSPRWLSIMGYTDEDVAPCAHRLAANWCTRTSCPVCRPSSAITSRARRRSSKACTA